MNKEKDFFQDCFNTVASLEVKNKEQSIAKEVVLKEIKNLQQENKILKEQVIGISNFIKYRNVNSVVEQQVLDYQIELENHYRIRYHKLKDNWNKLKAYFRKKYLNGYEKLYIEDILDKMQELEQGSDSND